MKVFLHRYDRKPLARPAVAGGQSVSWLSPERGAIRRKGWAAEAGQELVEFAVVVAALMMLMLGLVVFARAYNVWQTMTRAAREGARMAVLPTCATCGNSFIDNGGGTQSDPIFTSYIAPALQASNLNPNLVSNYKESWQFLDPGDADQQCGAVISFQYPYTLAIPWTSLNLTTINLSTQVQMRIENQPITPCGPPGP